MTDKPQTIVALKQENVMGIKLVNVKPDGSLFIVGGNNGEGKSSLTRGAIMALAGKREFPEEPLRRGKGRGEVVLETQDFVFKTVVKKGGRYTSTVTPKNGTDCGTATELRRKMLGALTFNPLEFKDLDEKKQAEILRKLVGVDTSEHDAKRKALFDERADTNREAKAAFARWDAAPFHSKAPKEEASLSELLAEIDRISTENAEKDGERELLEDQRAKVIEAKEVLRDMESRVMKLKADLSYEIEEGQKMAKRVEALEPNEDIQPLRDRLETAEEDNQKVRENAEHEKLKAESEELSANVDRMTEEIAEMDQVRKEMIASANMPVDDLAIEEGRVLFEGLPLKQVNTFSQVKVSTAIGLALNPQLRVLFIPGGSEIDKKGLAVMAEMAEKAGALIFMERVGDGEECSIVLEDGEVKA